MPGRIFPPPFYTEGCIGDSLQFTNKVCKIKPCVKRKMQEKKGMHFPLY